MLFVKDLCVKYTANEDSPVLDCLTFSIKSGERTALIGANGAGKSTLLLSLVGILTPVSGNIVFDGITLEKKALPELRKRIGMVFQNPDDQLFMPTVYEDIAFGPRNSGCREEELEWRIDRVLESLEILHLKRRLAHKLSGGEKRLVTLAGVLVMEPSLLLMDEPTSFLDPRARRRLITILANLEQAILLTTHDLDMALDLCERVILLKNGKIVADGQCREILSDTALLNDCGLEPPLSLK